MSSSVYYKDTTLLLHFNGTDTSTTFTDSSPIANTMTVAGNAQLSTGVNKYGTASGLFDGTGDYIRGVGHLGCSFGAYDFTIECWIRQTSGGGSTQVIYDSRPPGSDGKFPCLEVVSGKVVYLSDASQVLTSTTTLSADTWYHIALVRISGTAKLYINGTSEGGTYVSSAPQGLNTSGPYIGGSGNAAGTQCWKGYIDDLRVVKGVGVYAGNFSPPSAELPDSYARSSIGTGGFAIIPTTYSHKSVKFSSTGDLSLSLIVDDIKKHSAVTNINESLITSETFYSDYLIFLSEVIITLTAVNNNINYKQSVNESIIVLDSIVIAIKEYINESLIQSDTIIGYLQNIIEVIENIIILSQCTSGVSYLSNISEIFNLLDSLLFSISFSINENIVLIDIINQLQILINSILDNITLLGTPDNKYINIISISDIFNILDSNDTKSIINAILNESFILSIPTSSGQDTYLAYLLSPETNSITNYNNYNFKGCTKFGSKYLFYNSTGLYEYGGDTDNNVLVESHITTASYNFGSTNLKQVPSIYLGISNSDKIYLKVSVDGKTNTTYNLNKKTDNLQTQKIDIGKGLIGRYFQFELITKADIFNLESIDFYPIELRRKI